MFPTSNAKTFTRTFESKLFPTFSVSSVNIESIYDKKSSFIEKFDIQLKIIDDIISGNILNSGHIVKNDGTIIRINKEYYKNVPDFVLGAICEYGIEKGIAYQLFRMIYTYKIENTQVFNGESYDNIKFCNYKFDISKYNKEYINPLSSLWFKYSVVMTEKGVKTAIYSKESETPMKYFVKIKTPSPIVSTEIIAEQISDTSILFKIPNIFDPNSEEYLDLLLSMPEENVSDLSDSICNVGNVFLSQIRVVGDNIFVKFDGLTITNDFYLNRRAAKEEQENGVSSSEFFKLKLEDIAISVEEDTKISSRSRSLTRKRIRNTELYNNNEDDCTLDVSILRAKRVMHGIKNNRVSQ